MLSVKERQPHEFLESKTICPGFAVARQFAVVDGFAAPPMTLGVDVVKVRHQCQSIFFEEDIAIGVEKVRLILIDQIFDAVKIMPLPLGRRLTVIQKLLAVDRKSTRLNS